MKDVGRWKSVELEVDSTMHLDLLPLQVATAPILEVLKIKVHPQPKRLRTYPRITGAVDLFEGRACRLQVLHLDGIALPWHSALLRQVIDLELSGLVASKVELYDLLASNPGLRRLALGYVLPPSYYRENQRENYSKWAPKSSLRHDHLETLSIGWAYKSPAQAILPHLDTPNCLSLTVDMERFANNTTNEYLSTIDHICRHISISSFNDVNITWLIQASPLTPRHFKVQATFRLPNSYDIRFTLPAKFSASSTWIQTTMKLLSPIAPNLVVGVEFDWEAHTRHLKGTEHLMQCLGKIPNLKTMISRFGVDGRLLRIMSRPTMLHGEQGWLFSELEEFTVERGCGRTLAIDLLEMVKGRYSGIASDYDWGDESDDEDDQSIAEDSEESDEHEHGASTTDHDAPDSAQPSGVVHGPPPTQPQFWRKLELHELQTEHADICAEIFEVANISPILEHV